MEKISMSLLGYYLRCFAFYKLIREYYYGCTGSSNYVYTCQNNLSRKFFHGTLQENFNYCIIQNNILATLHCLIKVNRSIDTIAITEKLGQIDHEKFYKRKQISLYLDDKLLQYDMNKLDRLYSISRQITDIFPNDIQLVTDLKIVAIVLNIKFTCITYMDMDKMEYVKKNINEILLTDIYEDYSENSKSEEESKSIQFHEEL